MTIKDCQASFSNSRIKPRAATTEADTHNLVVNDTVALMFPYNENRTTLTIRNESFGNDFRYSYSAATCSATLGFLVRFGEVVEISGPMPVYCCAVTPGTSIPICADEGSG
jgi:hypothetical protein